MVILDSLFEYHARISVCDFSCSPAFEERSVKLVQAIRGRIMPAVMLLCLAGLSFIFVSKEGTVRASEPSSTSLQEQADGLMRNVDEMVAHGGMGDAKAIIHHCGEASRYAEEMVKQLSASGSRRDDAVTSLNEVIRQCRRVSEIGPHADPGQLLNPATKARAAAQESVKLLGLAKPKKS